MFIWGRRMMGWYWVKWWRGNWGWVFVGVGGILGWLGVLGWRLISLWYEVVLCLGLWNVGIEGGCEKEGSCENEGRVRMELRRCWWNEGLGIGFKV